MEIVENGLQRNQEDEENMKQEEGVETKITNLTEGFNESLKKKKSRRVEEIRGGLSSIPVVYFETNIDLLVNILGICGGE